jgi:lipoate-protein ligase A
VVIKPIYIPQGVFQEDFTGMPVKLAVHDNRDEKKRIFYHYDWMIWREDGKGGYVLKPSSREIIERALRKAMESGGYLLSDDASVVIDVSVQQFIWRVEKISGDAIYWFGRSLSYTAYIKLDVSITRYDATFLKKTFADTVERKPTFSNLYQQDSMFSECLSKIVEKIASDYNFISAIKKSYENESEFDEVISSVHH